LFILFGEFEPYNATAQALEVCFLHVCQTLHCPNIKEETEQLETAALSKYKLVIAFTNLSPF